MYNPFYDIVKADELSPHEVADFFIKKASPIWSDVQYPVNHLVIGPRGAGKTIALRQLDHKSAPVHDRPPFLGIYVQITRIATTFQHILPTDDSPSPFQRVFADYLWFELVREVARFLSSPSCELRNPDHRLLKRITDGTLASDSIADVHDECVAVQQTIDESISRWSIDKKCTWVPRVDLPSSLFRMVETLRKAFPRLGGDRPSVYLLFDESSPIPRACQRTINGLLHRGRPYCVKLAFRPYEWSTLTTAADRTVELDADVKPLHIEYADELGDDYVEDMRRVANKILDARITNADEPKDGWPVSTDLDIVSILGDEVQEYSGFRSVCATSSGNPQNLLSICSCIVSTAIRAFTARPHTRHALNRIPAELQQEAIIRWSKDYEDRNPYPRSRTFCRSLLQLLRNQEEATRSLGFECVADEPELFTPEYLPDGPGKSVSPAFSGGFLRNSEPDRASLFEVPSAFHLSRGLLPRERLKLDLPVGPPNEISRTFLQQNTRERVHLGSRNESSAPATELKAFLSTSFTPSLEQQRIEVKRALASEQIECVDVGDKPSGQFLFTSIHRQIRRNDMTILDATILRPYTMLELGLAASVSRPGPVICIVNDEDKGGLPSSLPAYIKKLELLTFSFDARRLSDLAVRVRSRYAEMRRMASEFVTAAPSDVALRARRRSASVFVSLPKRPLRDAAIEAIKERMARLRWSVIVEDDYPGHYANEFQVAIQCAYRCRVGVIDTTGENGPDLLQSYKLGLFVGRRVPWPVRQVEEQKYANRDTFASVPGLVHGTWNTIDDLVAHVEAVVKSAKK